MSSSTDCARSLPNRSRYASSTAHHAAGFYVHDALVLVEPPPHIVQCLEAPLPRTPVRPQEALRSLDAFPRDVLARTAFSDASHPVPIDLDPNRLCLRTLRRAMLEALPEGYDDAVKRQRAHLGSSEACVGLPLVKSNVQSVAYWRATSLNWPSFCPFANMWRL